MRLRIVVLAFALAWSFNTEAQIDSCHYNPDVDHDGLITVVDLMGLLGFFGSADPDLDCWFGPEDDCFGVVDACGVCGGDGVDADADGVCDDADDCVGALDACGICNGPGPVVQVVDSVVITMDSVYFEEMDFWFVYQTDVDTLFSLTCPTPGCTDPAAWNFDPSANWEDGSCLNGPLQCGEVTSVNYHGHDYPVVAIGDQCWFAENLRTLNFRNGDPIYLSDSTESWPSMGKPAAVAYDYNDEIAAERGYLYTGFVAIDQREACPAGWRIPLDADFAELEDFLGMPEESWFTEGWRGSDEAFALKASPEDDVPWNGTNTTGFAAVPMGDIYDSFQGGAGGVTFWARDGLGWNSDNYYRAIESGGGIVRSTHNIFAGHTLRCMRTMEAEACWDPDGDGICPEDEIGGCLDPGAWNYNPDATANAFNCTYGPPECGDVSSVNYQGHDYPLVAIGDQCWFSENLRSSTFTNGDSIPFSNAPGTWTSTTAALHADVDEANPAWGKHYNGWAVWDSRGLCPSGFRVGSDQDWQALEAALGMEADALSNTWLRGTDQGWQMKASQADPLAWDGTNSSGMTIVPSAMRQEGLTPQTGIDALIWSPNANQVNNASFNTPSMWLWYRQWLTNDGGIIRFTAPADHGFGVRCVRAEGDCFDPDGDGVCAENESSGCTNSMAANFDPSATEDDGSCSASACGDLESIHFDGYDYAVVGVGAQCWFAENLRSWHYANGDSIPVPESGEEWMAAEEGVVGTYADGAVNCAHFCWPDSAASLFGNLYNGYAVTDERNVCPNGWHAPSNDEWLQLEQFTAAYVGDSVSFALRAGFLWDNPEAGSDVWGMGLLPAGGRDIWTGGPEAMLDANAAAQGQFWTTNIHPGSDELGWMRYYHHNHPEPSVGLPSRKEGKSVRCLLD